MKKQFTAVWGNWDEMAINSYEELQKTVADSFFFEENGYDREDIKAVAELAINDRWDSPYGNHYIIRTN